MSENRDRNLMTPTEAAKKICRLTLQRDGGVGSCVPEGCMAWRWASSLTVAGGTTQIEQTRGYCGLAVKP